MSYSGLELNDGSRKLREQFGIIGRASELRNRILRGSFSDQTARNLARINRAEANMLNASYAAKGNGNG